MWRGCRNPNPSRNRNCNRNPNPEPNPKPNPKPNPNPNQVPVSLALNGVTFGVTGVPVRFYYKGLHVPVLVDVYFPQAAAS